MPDNVTLSTPDGEMKLYDAAPPGHPRGGVIVIQEAFGVNDHIEDVTRRFAAAGYRAVSPHLFHRSGDAVLGYEDMSQVVPHMQAVSQQGLIDDLDATLAFLAGTGLDRSRVGVVGFCMGGSVSFYTAVRYPLGAAVSFYGGGVSSGRFGFAPQTDLAAQLQTPWLGLYGDRDGSIPVDEVEALRQAATGSSVPTEVVRYPEAEHGFHCDARPSYNAEASEDAWRRTLAWFDTHLGPAS